MRDKSFWIGKRVLITGVNGFIGGNLAKHLIELGAEVVGIEKSTARNTLLDFEGLAPKVKRIMASITDFEAMKAAFLEEDIEFCFHLAAQVEVGIAREYPFLTWETNVRGTYTVLEAARCSKHRLKGIVVASTDKSYGSYPRNKMPYKEDYPLQATFPYDVSKACADMIARSYTSPLYELPIAVTRFCNIFGPGQLNFSAIVPDCARAALGYGEFIPRGDGTQVRDFIYTGDVVRLYSTIAQRLAEDRRLAGEVFNAGTNSPRTVRDVVTTVFTAADALRALDKVNERFAGNKTVGEIDCQFMDFEKVNRVFGWRPETTFETGVRETVSWYREYLGSRYGESRGQADDIGHHPVLQRS